MARIFFFFLFMQISNFDYILANSHSIVFIHLGEKLPIHLEVAVCQARLFNTQSQIILVANQQALSDIPSTIQQQNVLTIPCETLELSAEHLAFRKVSRKHDGFWVYTSERFLYLYDLMLQYQLENVFHLENDNMLYANLEELMPVFKTSYPGIAATFDNDKRCIPGFIYISNLQIMQELAAFFAQNRNKGNDMKIIALFKNTKGRKKSDINTLPIIPESYATDHVLKSKSGNRAKIAAPYFNNIDLFQSLFDAAAIGQYLGGGDIYLHPTIKPGFINEACIFNPSYFKFEWKDDLEGRSIPYAIYNGQSYRMNNIHVHSKELHLFSSK